MKDAICAGMSLTWLVSRHPRFQDGMVEQTRIHAKRECIPKRQWEPFALEEIIIFGSLD